MQNTWFKIEQWRILTLLKLSQTTGWRTKCHTIDCAHNTFLLLQKYLTSGTELILIGWKIVPNEEHVQCGHRFASQPLAFSGLQRRPENVAQLRAHIVKLCRALSVDLCRKVVTNARVRCDAKRWSHWTCSSLGTILKPTRINSVPDVKSFCNNKNVLRAQSMVWQFVRHPVC